MSLPCLLLDVDGVVVKDRLLMSHVKHNSIRYVKNKLPECKDPALLNKYLLLAHGHTGVGLHKQFGIDVNDFNTRVYDKSLMTHLAEVLETPGFQGDAEIINDLILSGWNVTLFSNAPFPWVHRTALAISDKLSVRCPGGNPATAYFKPNVNFYKEFDTCKSYYFVDDSLKNLGAVRNMPNWRPIYFYDQIKENNLWCPQVTSIHELALLLSISRIPGNSV